MHREPEQTGSRGLPPSESPPLPQPQEPPRPRPPRPEQTQALARMGIAVLIAVAVAALWPEASSNAVLPSLLAVSAGYFAVALAQLLFVDHGRETPPWRRYAMMLADLGAASAGLHLLGVGGLALYPLLLWIVIGNGLRYGALHLHNAAAIGVAGFLLATVMNGSWSREPVLLTGLLAGLLILPRVFLALLRRLGESNDRLRSKLEEAEYLATHDPLTDLPNRALLEDRLEQALARCERSGARFAVILVDIDAFKVINDSFGHAAGDRLLRRAANCLSGHLRATDTVARLTGDTFILLVEGIAGAREIAGLVERVSRCMEGYFQVDERQTYVTWSSGVALYPEDGRDVATLTSHAETAINQAKAAGGNQCRFFDAEMTQEVNVQLRLRDALRRAVPDDELVIHYQPLVDIVTGRLIGAEALLRWRHPEHGLLAPGEFIEVAEQSGLIVPIGEWVLRLACDDQQRWQAAGLPMIDVSVNVSTVQLTQPRFIDALREALTETGADGRRLQLELTESLLLEDNEHLAELFAAIHELGVRLSLDDFGTGYSSLSYLQRFPVDVLKIDRCFVHGLPESENDRALVEAMIAIGASMGVEVVAEGVETPAQRRWLAGKGCQRAQGFLFSRPLEREDFERLLRENRKLVEADGLDPALPR